MTILTEASLDFAKEHISRYYDTDFFPKPFEFDAIWSNWSEVKQELSSRNVAKLQISSPVSFPWKKPSNGYRVVHQLDPLDSIIYTALAFSVSKEIESARQPRSQFIACAYRIEAAHGSFFSLGTGYSEFRQRSEELSEKFNYILLTDISDFYNQIYLHRLQNSIEFADRDLRPLADDIEDFLTRLNNKASQGVPVGPAASIVFSESTLIDVDQFLINQGVTHTRYVDDFRIFANDDEVLENILQKLTLYLYDNHRLTLSGEKTRIMSSGEFVANDLNNPYEIEKTEVFKEIEVLDEYSLEYTDRERLFDHDASREKIESKLCEQIESVLRRNHFDLGYSRALLRQARNIDSTAPLELVIRNLDVLLPAFNNAILYLDHVTDSVIAEEALPLIREALGYTSITTRLPGIWLEWYLGRHRAFRQDPEIRNFLSRSANLVTQCRLAVQERNLSWVRDKKNRYFNFGPWDRRAILYAARVLPTDERNHWLKGVVNASPLPLDRWVAEWSMHGEDENDF